MPRVETERPEPEQLTLFGGEVDMQALRMERAAIAGARRSVATQRAYASDWRDFAAWCAMAGRRGLPATSDTVSLYLVYLARAGRLVSTIARRATAIAAQHLAAGEASPVTADVGELLGALRRKLGTAPRAKVAVSVEQLRVMLGVVPAGPRGVRDRAVLLLGFASGLRRSEVVALDAGDVDLVREGLVVRLARSKTDQEGRGRELGVHRGERRATCPARAVEAWLRVRGEWAGPLFCPVGQLGAIERRRLAPAVVARIVKRAASRAGLDPRAYGGHSLRAGCATAAAAGGADALAIMGRTGHRSVAMVGRYVRHGSLFARDPLSGAL